jgi:hypothetical protein
MRTRTITPVSRKTQSARRANRSSPDPGLLWQVLIVTLCLVGTGYFLFAERQVAGVWGYSLDDSWIYAVYAKNLATGQGYSFNPGEHVAGATGPLYVFLLAAIYLIFQDVVFPVKVLGILCFAASALIVFRTVRLIIPDRVAPAGIAGVLVAASPSLIWGSLSGMEIPEYLLLTCLGMYFYVARRWTLAVLMWGIGVWLRPEGLLLAFLGLVLRPGLTWKNSVKPALLLAVLVITYFAFNYSVGGWILPNSVKVAAKPGDGFFQNQWVMLTQCADLWTGSLGVRRLAMHAALLLPAMLVGAVVVLKRWPVLVAYFVLFPAALAMFRAWGGQFGRYIAHTVPFGLVLAAVGIDYAMRRATPTRYTAGILVVGMLCLGWQVHAARKVGIIHGWNVQNIDGMHRWTADALRRATTPGDTIAVNDVGAIGYFSGCYVVDLVGLVSEKRSFPDYLTTYRPQYMIAFPDWFQDFAAIDSATDNIVFYSGDSTYKYSPFLGVRLKRNTISSRNTIYLYERMGRNEVGIGQVPLVVH